MHDVLGTQSLIVHETRVGQEPATTRPLVSRSSSLQLWHCLSPAAGRYRLSPHCVFVPDPDGQSIVITHSVYGSRFKLDARFLAALLSDDRVAQSKLAKKSPAAWTSVGSGAGTRKSAD